MRERDFELLAEARTLARDGTARRLRQHAGMTLAEVGETVGVGRSTIQRWETGQQRPTGEIALRYGEVLRRLKRREHRS